MTTGRINQVTISVCTNEGPALPSAQALLHTPSLRTGYQSRRSLQGCSQSNYSRLRTNKRSPTSRPTLSADAATVTHRPCRRLSGRGVFINKACRLRKADGQARAYHDGHKDGLTLARTVKHDRATDEVTTSSRMHQRKGQPSRVVPLIRTANQVSLAGVHYNKATTE